MLTIFAGFMIAFLSIAGFCFYCGLETLSQSIKKDGIKEVLKTAAMIYVVVGIILLVTFKVGNALTISPSRESVRAYKVLDV